mmetsp:Transcript_13114/g.30629  ORF Transcript_13114/g.30629 Transcript_13114/m.30629 type:complete len:167 (+) Transcript_13114:150-650(+)
MVLGGIGGLLGGSMAGKLPGASSYGGLMSQGYVPPGQFEDLLNLIRQASAAAERAMNAAKYSEMAASAAGVAGQQAVTRAMHMANAPGAPAASPFAPGSPEPGLGVGQASVDEVLLALVATRPVPPSNVERPVDVGDEASNAAAAVLRSSRRRTDADSFLHDIERR